MTARGLDPRGLELAGVVRQGEFTLTLDCVAAPGEVLAVLGPNGAGKSTLLRAVAGLLPMATGHIRIAGVTVDDPEQRVFVPPEVRRVGYVFQNYRLFPHLSLLENVAFGPRSRGVSARQARDTARYLLDHLDLPALADRKPGQVSGGQAQRAALARALAGDPEILLLDEPLAALDARTKVDTRSSLRGYLDEFTGPVILVTHDPLEAMVLADRLLVLEGGEKVQEGSPAEVARRPRTDYVARLVGLNIYPGTLDRSTRTVVLDAGGTLVVTPDPEAGTRVFAALRPAAITVHTRRPEPGSARNVWTGEVTGVEMAADRVRLDVTGEPDALVDITAAAVAELGLDVGSRVWLSAKAQEVEAYPA